MSDLHLHPVDVGFDLRITQTTVKVPGWARSAEIAEGGERLTLRADSPQELVRLLESHGFLAEVEPTPDAPQKLRKMFPLK